MEQLKYPCFNGWPDKEYLTCIHHHVCGLVRKIEEIYQNIPTYPLTIHVDCEKKEFPKQPRKKRVKKIE